MKWILFCEFLVVFVVVYIYIGLNVSGLIVNCCFMRIIESGGRMGSWYYKLISDYVFIFGKGVCLVLEELYGLRVRVVFKGKLKRCY